MQGSLQCYLKLYRALKRVHKTIQSSQKGYVRLYRALKGLQKAMQGPQKDYKRLHRALKRVIYSLYPGSLEFGSKDPHQKPPGHRSFSIPKFPKPSEPPNSYSFLSNTCEISRRRDVRRPDRDGRITWRMSSRWPRTSIPPISVAPGPGKSEKVGPSAK